MTFRHRAFLLGLGLGFGLGLGLEFRLGLGLGLGLGYPSTKCPCDEMSAILLDCSLQ